VTWLVAGCDAGTPQQSTTPETAVEHAIKHQHPKYVCPMHPQIVKDEPGHCPICGMDLVKKETPATADASQTSARKPGIEHLNRHSHDATYVCPMHPSIVKHEPGHCPICGMDLVKKESTASSDKYSVVNVKADVQQKMGVRTALVKKGQLAKQIKTVGYVAYDERRLEIITSQTDGWVENLTARRIGLKVTKGQLLLELYSPEFLRVQKDFIKEQKKDRSGTLTKYGARQESVESRDHLRYIGVPESMMNEIARYGKPRFRLPIYAPIHGEIVETNIKKNQYVQRYEPMLSIADLTTVWVEANVYENQLEWVKLGQSADVEVKALPGKHFPAQITYIYPELDPKTRTMKVRLLVPNPDELLKPNMFAEVKIATQPKKDILLIPRQAVIETGERESVVLDKGNGEFQPIDVVTGMRSQNKVEVLSGLKEGDRVVVSGQFLIDSEANLQASFERLKTQ
jgi:Cu(I)/Ag(I) efflux system membrane fusion protein